MGFERRVFSIVALLGVVLMAAPGYAQESDVTYYKDVLPIVQDNCQTCHRGRRLQHQRRSRPDVVDDL